MAALPPVEPGSRAEKGPELDDSAACAKWVRARAADARAGKRAIVRMPIGVPAGGATAPDTFIGAWLGGSITLGQDGITPEWEPGVPHPSGMQTSIVEGWFTGTQKKEGGGGGPSWDTFGFHATRARAGSPDEADARHLQVVLSGPEASRELPALHDDRPWLLVAASLPLLEKDVDAHAESARAKLVAEGFDQAEVIDSRQATGLFCCFRNVLAGRYASDKEAREALARVKHAHPGAFVRKGW
jgi:hypothetical protein